MQLALMLMHPGAGTVNSAQELEMLTFNMAIHLGVTAPSDIIKGIAREASVDIEANPMSQEQFTRWFHDGFATFMPRIAPAVSSPDDKIAQEMSKLEADMNAPPVNPAADEGDTTLQSEYRQV